jgi:DNA replication protein
MDLRMAIKWIDEGIIDFSQLILHNYKNIGLNEAEAFVLIELQKQSKAGVTFLNPKKMVKNLSMTLEELLGVLDRMIQHNFLSMKMVKNENGKEAEVFDLNDTVSKILKFNHQEMDEIPTNPSKKYATNEEELVDLIEKEFQKQLTPLEIEVLGKWVAEDRFPIFDIKKAVLDAKKANKNSLSYVDSLLLKRAAAAKKEETAQTPPVEPEALKTFFESWPKK